MKQIELFDFAEKNFKKCLEILKKKNHDYSKGDDALKNFRASEFLGVKMVDGVLARMSDKFMRIGTLLHGADAKVKEETLEDTILDLVNYAIILKAIIEDKNA